MDGSRQALERLFLDHLDWIERAIAALARRHAMSPDEADDFASWSKLKLMEDDYAVLRKFRGDSSLTTYLAVVLSMYLREYRVYRWGRWRPSAAARRRGPLAIRLETLLRREGYGLSQAGEILRAETAAELGDRQLAELAAALPQGERGRPREVDLVRVVDNSADNSPEAQLWAAEEEAERSRAEKALSEALAALQPEDRLVLRMHFWENLAVADIARALGIPQKPLYRRIHRLVAALKPALERAGITRDVVRDLMASDRA